MKTLLIPVDFSETAENAVNFAAEWSRKYGYERIILLKTFYDSVFESIALSAEYSNFNEDNVNRERFTAVEQLQQLCRELASKTNTHVKVMTAISELPLLRAILETIQDENVELIIAGSDTKVYSSDSFVSGHVISIAKASPVKVLIVPSTCTYHPVTDALVPCDFNALTPFDKVNNLRATPQWHDVRLQVLNVDAKERYLNPDEKLRKGIASLHEYLKSFQHQLHYSNERNVIKGINQFINDHDVQLIIALPGKHSFLYNLTHNSISEAIYRETYKPVLILK